MEEDVWTTSRRETEGRTEEKDENAIEVRKWLKTRKLTEEIGGNQQESIKKIIITTKKI